MGLNHSCPRDLLGYGPEPPDPQWPNQAKVAVQFVLNYEEGGENCVLYGDPHSESYLWEIVGAPGLAGVRNMNIESIYEYGSRSGVWRILGLFREIGLPLTVYAVGMALERNPTVAARMLADGHEIATHGYRWIDYQYVGEEAERAHLQKAIEIQRQLTGSRPLGCYIGRISPNTRRIVAEEGGFLYNSDVYNDDLPYWELHGEKPLLLVPYTLDVNDMKFGTAQGFNTGEDFFNYARAAFDTLYKEGETSPKMMSIGLHCRLIGRPGRFEGLCKFVEYIQQHERVWVTRRVDIAKHWQKVHPVEKWLDLGTVG